MPLLVTIGIATSLAVLIALQARRTSSLPPVIPPGAAVASQERTDSSASIAPKLSPPAGEDVPPIGEFFYLMDVSASTKNVSGQGPFEEGIVLLQPIFGALRGLQEIAPQRHRVATIGALSLGEAALCDIYVAQKTLFTETADSGRAGQTMRACERDLRGLEAAQYTDIGGALVNASISIRGKRPALRGIVILSDMVEDAAPGTVLGRPDLRGMCVVVYTLVTTQSARDPSGMNARQGEWSQKLRGWGARDVMVASARGFDAGDLRGFLRGCER